MRIKKDIEKNAEETLKIDRLILEVLLDIRELLGGKKKKDENN